jgi:hypothetical protein
MFKILPYSKELREDWDTVVRKSKNGCFMHLRSYIDYNSYRFDERSVLIYRDKKPVAVFPSDVQNAALTSYSGLTYAGFIFGFDLCAKHVVEIFELLIKHYRSLGLKSLIYKAIPYIFHRYPCQEDLYALYRSDAYLVRRDLSSALKMNCRPNLSDSRKSIIRRAKNFDITIGEDQDCPEFHKLLTSVLQKFDKTPTHSVSELETLKRHFPSEIKLFTLRLGGDLLSAALIYDFGKAVHTQYLASSEHGRKIGGLDCLLNWLISEVYFERDYFSFGISTEEEGRYLNEGLLFQKESFGGRAIVHDFYKLDFN